MQPQLTWNVWNDLHQLVTFHFMVNALEAGTIVAVLAALIGWFMVLRNQSFAGHTLAVVGFPGAAGATLLGLPLMAGYFGFCGAAALVIAAVPRSHSESRSEESAVIGTVQAFALAGGILFVNLYKGFLDGVDSLLFGDFLGVTNNEVWVLLIVAIAAVVVLGVIARPLFFSSVDADVAFASGVPVKALSVAFLVLLGVAVAEVSQITGSLLVFALLVMPTATAQRLSAKPSTSLCLSVVIGVVVTWLGLGVSYFSPYPVGFWLTTFAFAAYLIAVGIDFARKRVRHDHVSMEMAS